MYQINKLDGSAEVWVSFGVCNHRRVENVASTFNVNTGLVHGQKMHALHVPQPPEQNFNSANIETHTEVSHFWKKLNLIKSSLTCIWRELVECQRGLAELDQHLE
jgi:hypothetical protein